jgi:hypothetical protein
MYLSPGDPTMALTSRIPETVGLTELVPPGTLTWGARLVSVSGEALMELQYPHLTQLRRLSKDHATVVAHLDDHDRVRRLKVYAAYLELWSATI